MISREDIDSTEALYPGMDARHPWVCTLSPHLGTRYMYLYTYIPIGGDTMPGGARPNSGRKKKFEEEGQEGDTYTYRVPEEVPKEVVDKAIIQWFRENKGKNN